MCTLTEYRKPKPRYGLEDAGWRAMTGWEITEGRWQRIYRLHRYGCFNCRRRAVVRRQGGGWVWSVTQWRGASDAREIARGVTNYVVAQMAMPFAELAAKSK